MHIAHIMANNSSVPYFNWFAEEIQKYPEHQFSFIVLYPTRPQMLDDIKQRHCSCYWVKFDDSRRKASMLAVVPKLVKLLKQIEPDAVNTHLFDDSLPGLLAARLAGIKRRIITKGDTTYHWNYAPKWVWADRFNNFNATNIVAISNESKAFIIDKERADTAKVSLIHHGIPFQYACHQTDGYKQVLRDKYKLNGRIIIGTIARLIEWKGYRYIIEGAAQIVKQYPSVKFLFAGEGPQHNQLTELIALHGLQDHVILIGWVERAYVPSLYGIMDVYVHAASTEPFGFVIAEAMANGVPLVTTKTGAAADALIHQESCYFVAEKNGADIAAGITWMLEDTTRRKTIAEKVKKTAHAMYDIKDMVKNYLNLYTS
jgi:glycosyltransferase involved in cell wall biosynthesis